jgi:ketosteroid isomerase-like protein
MALQMTRTDEEAQIRGLIEDWAKAARASDIDGIMAAYAPDIRSFEAGDEVAFGHYLLKCGATGEDGGEQTGWTRATVCWRKRSGRWMVAHEHFSVPFDMESGKALLGLEP